MPIMRIRNQDIEKINLNTNILVDTERRLECLQRCLREKKVRRGSTSKGMLIDILVKSPEAIDILDREFL